MAPSSQGDFQHGIVYPEEPGGVWANNLVSDPVGSTVFWLADHVLLIPELAPDVSATSLLRRTVELWINDGASPEGQVYSSGHKNAYVNALAYRAWRGMAKLQASAGRMEKAGYFNGLADRLKQVYRDTFFNPETGWLGWWRSADGELHDVWSDMLTSMAILYGLVTPTEGRQMLDKYWTALENTGFHNFELGLPLNVRPIPPALMLTGFGGKLEDGSDNNGKWLNGGCTLSNTSFWLAANYTVGNQERADRVLNAMLARQARSIFPNGGSFQNGIVDNPPNGAECFDWKGGPCGYEGHLVYSWTWMQSLLLRDPEVRQRVFDALH